jgi:hypothetical protein
MFGYGQVLKLLGSFHFSSWLGPEWLASLRHLGHPRSLIGGRWRWSSVEGSGVQSHVEESGELEEEVLEANYFFEDLIDDGIVVHGDVLTGGC